MDLIQDHPIIAAVKNEDELDRALTSECRVIFLLFGSLLNIDTLVARVKEKEKAVIVHIDFVEGLSGKEIAVDFLQKYCYPDGIISTKGTLIKRAKKLGMVTVHRIFILDSLSADNISTVLESSDPDYVEILPGIIPRVIREVCGRTPTPVITGGLIKTKEEVINDLNAGAIAVSTSCPEVWNM